MRRKLARPGEASLLDDPVRSVPTVAAALIFAGALGLSHDGVTAPPPSTPRATSVGAPNQGRLEHGAHLDTAPHLRIVPFYADEDVRWGLPTLVGLVDRAGRRVAKRFPGAVLSVGDLSRRRGGDVDRHHSHESGRDVDLGFYALDRRGKPLLADRFVPFTPDGVSVAVAGARFDDARNWELVAALVGDPAARVSHIFVSAGIRARLLRYAERSGASAALRARAAERMVQPRRSSMHDDHFHVRISCPSGQRGTCVEHPFRIVHRTRPTLAESRRRTGAESARARRLPPLPPPAPDPALDDADLRSANNERRTVEP